MKMIVRPRQYKLNSLSPQNFRALGLFLSPIFVSCVTQYKVVEDFAPSPIDWGKGRLETSVCGRYNVGDNICWLEKGVEPTIEVYTYFEGKIYLTSELCKIDKTVLYSDSKHFKINLNDLVLEFPGMCVIDILMAPNFPGQEKSEAEVGTISGRVIFMAKKEGEYLATVLGPNNIGAHYAPGAVTMSVPLKQVTNLINGFAVIVSPSQNGRLVIAGCGYDAKRLFYDSAEPVSIALMQLMDDMVVLDQEHCLFYGKINRWDQDDYLVFLVAVEVYSDQLIALADPIITQSGDLLNFQSFETVSWTFVDDKKFNSSYGTVKVNPDKLTKIVQLTVQGRSKVVLVKDGKIVWSD